MSLFELRPNFLEKCSYSPIYGKVHRMTSNVLDMFKVTNTNMHATNTPEAQIYIRFALQ